MTSSPDRVAASGQDALVTTLSVQDPLLLLCLSRSRLLELLPLCLGYAGGVDSQPGQFIPCGLVLLPSGADTVELFKVALPLWLLRFLDDLAGLKRG